MKRLHDPRQGLHFLRQQGYIEQYSFWNPPDHDARWIVISRYHKIHKGDLEEHRYTTDELKRWFKQLADYHATLRKALK